MEGSSSRVDWSKLPVELWLLIGKHLKTRIEILQFRSVCSSWHSSIPPFQPPIPPRFPSPFSTGPDAFLSQSTVYLLKLYPGPDPVPNPNLATSSSSSSSSSSSKGWLLKLEESEKLRLLNPISSRQIRYFNDSFPKASDLLDFKMVELCKTYALGYSKWSGNSIYGLTKVVSPPNLKDCAILVIYNEGKLGFARNGDLKLTLVDDRISDYNDLIVYKGQSYVVDRWGTVFWIDSSLKVLQVSPLLFGLGPLGQRKHLVESCGELYVVDRYLEQIPNMQDDRDGLFYGIARRCRRVYYSCEAKAVDFKVYKLDEEWGRWVEVKSLGDQAFFLSVDCSFSVSARELAGCKGNCIYFTDQNDVGLALRNLSTQDGSVFNLEDHSIERLELGNSQIFWPPQPSCASMILSSGLRQV